ncbi:MAG: type II toxin-antitoxin system Phd/YefM family antitoxin [marine benthic group bacterium]|jgi:prevent-host-death family protein|nr:type II toxin-antitoxin system Phd/YefM family antitoxin [Candidatus Benthicola marisminoris]
MATDKLTVEIHGGVAYVKMSEARKHLSTIIDKVLTDHEHVVVQKRGKTVAVISRPDSTLDSVETKTY